MNAYLLGSGKLQVPDTPYVSAQTSYIQWLK